MTDDYLERLRAAVDDDEDVLAVMWELYPKLREDLRAAVVELERLRKDATKLGEHVAPVDDREPMDVNRAAEALYAYADQRSTQSQFGNQLRAALDSRQSWRYRAFKLEDDVEQLRARRAALGPAEHQWRIVSPSGFIHSFTQRDLDDRANWLPGVRLEKRTVYGTPWVDTDPKQPEYKTCGIRPRTDMVLRRNNSPVNMGPCVKAANHGGSLHEDGSGLTWGDR